MSKQSTRIDISAAYQDLHNWTLSRLPGDIARLVYLASTRDYNSGRYYHDGLAFHFTGPAAAMALEACHREVFDRLVFCTLEELLEELEVYFRSTPEDVQEVVKAWDELGAYRVSVPTGTDPVAGALFLSNIKVALAIWRLRQSENRASAA